MDNDQKTFKGLYKKYAECAEYVCELKEAIEEDRKYDISEVRNISHRVRYVIEDIRNHNRINNSMIATAAV